MKLLRTRRSPRLLLAGLAVSAVLVAPSLAQSTRTVDDGASTFSDELQGLDGWLQGLVEDGEVVAAAALVGVGEDVSYRGVAGHLERGGAELPADAIFRIYSMTKPITSVAAMILVEEGRLALDDPVAKYLPAFEELEVAHFEGRPSWETLELLPAENVMTVRHLLNHTSGLIYGIFARGPLAEMYAEAQVWDPENDLLEFAERVASLPLVAEPGTKHTYSVSTDILGAVIQVAADMPLEAFLAKRVFEPLGMVDTGFHVPEAKHARFCHLYYQAGGQAGRKDEDGRAAYLSAPRMPSGGGGLVSTVADYARFCRLLANEGALGEVRLLREETFRTMTQAPAEGDPAAVAYPPGLGFGLGFLVVADGSRVGAPLATGQISWGGMASTDFFVNPGKDLYGIFMTQILPTNGGYGIALQRQVYGAWTGE